MATIRPLCRRPAGRGDPDSLNVGSRLTPDGHVSWPRQATVDPLLSFELSTCGFGGEPRADICGYLRETMDSGNSAERCAEPRDARPVALRSFQVRLAGPLLQHQITLSDCFFIRSKSSNRRVAPDMDEFAGPQVHVYLQRVQDYLYCYHSHNEPLFVLSWPLWRRRNAYTKSFAAASGSYESY